MISNGNIDRWLETWSQGTAIKRENERKRRMLAEMRAIRAAEHRRGGGLPPLCTMRGFVMLAAVGAVMFVAGFLSTIYWVVLSR